MSENYNATLVFEQTIAPGEEVDVHPSKVCFLGRPDVDPARIDVFLTRGAVSKSSELFVKKVSVKGVNQFGDRPGVKVEYYNEGNLGTLTRFPTCSPLDIVFTVKNEGVEAREFSLDVRGVCKNPDFPFDYPFDKTK